MSDRADDEVASIGTHMRVRLRTAVALRRLAFTDGHSATVALTQLIDTLAQSEKPISFTYQNETGMTVPMQFIAMYARIKEYNSYDDAPSVNPPDAGQPPSIAHAAVSSMLQKCDFKLCNAEGWDALGLATREPMMIGLWLPQRLIELGADVNARGPDGSAPFLRWTANASCTFEQLQLLLDHGGDLTHVDREGNTVLHHLETASR
jgi:hypothetical protein